MKDDETPSEEQEPQSIFDGEVEIPEEGAHTIGQPGDDAVRKTVDKDGNLHIDVATGDIDPFDHSAEQDAVRKKQQEDGTAPLPMPPTEDEPIRNPVVMMDSADKVRTEIENRFRQEFDDLKVEVDATERSAFVRAALHDEEFIIDVELEGIGATITVAIPPDEFTNSAAAAVKYWGQNDYIDPDSDLQWLLGFQQIHAWYQVRAINGTPTEWSDFWADGMPKIRDIRAAMRDYSTFDKITGMNSVRWRMCLDAVRMAELKYKLCMQNWRDRTFFTGAGTD